MLGALRGIGAFLLAVIALAIGLVVLVFVGLTIPPLRAFALKQGLSYANSVMGGYTVEVDALDRLDPWGANVRGIRLRDDQQREVVRVKWVLVRIDPLAALGKTLRLTRVEIDDVEAHLYPTEEGPPEPEDTAPSEPSTFTYRADQLRVRGASLHLALSGRALHAVVGTLRAGGQYGPTIGAAIQEARLRVDEGKNTLLRLQTTEGDWTSERGGKVGLSAQTGGATLTVEADVKPLDAFEPWPVNSASLRLDRLTRRELEALGVTDGAELKVPVSLALDARSKGPKLTVQGQLRAGRGGLALSASADDQAYDLTVDVRPSQLFAIAGILPDLTVQGELRARATPTTGTPEKVELRWTEVALDGAAVPDGIVRAELPLPIVRLKGLTLAGMEQALEVRGEFDTERGRGDAHLTLHDFQLEAIQYLAQLGLAGTLNGDLGANFTPTTIDAAGQLALRGFRHPSAQLEALDLSLAADGPLTSPVGNFRFRLQQLTAGEVRVDQLTAEAQATADKLNGRLQVRGPTTLLNAEVGGMRTEDGDLRAQAIGRGYVQKRDLRFDLRELLYGEGGLSVQELSLYSGKQFVRIRGYLDANDQVEATLKLRAIDLAEVGKIAGLEGLSGKLTGDLHVAGSTALPKIDTKLTVTAARYKAELPLNATLALTGDLGARKLETTLQAYSSDELGAKFSAAVALPQRPDALAEAAQHARVEAKLAAWMPIEQISAIVGDQLVGLEGMLEANVDAKGTLDDPTLKADVTAAMKLPGQEGEPVEAIRLTTDVTKEQGKLSVWTKDEAGELLQVNGFVDWPGGSPRAALERPEGFQTSRFEVKADLSSRRFDAMQGVFAYFSKLYALSLPIRAAGSVSLAGDQGKLDGAARLALVVYGDKLDGRCRLGAESAVDLDAKLKQDHVEVDLKARTDGGGEIAGMLETRLDFGALRGDQPMVGPSKVTLKGEQIAVHKLPGLCNLAGGDADFTLEASGLGRQKPTLDVKAALRDLHAPEMAPIAFDVHARAAGAEAALNARIQGDGGADMGGIEAKLPLTYPDGLTPTVLPNAPVKARVRFDKLPLANVLAFTQALGRTSGTASADIDVSGKLNDPYPVGFFQVDDVNLSIAAIAQPLRDIDGRVDIKGRSVNIKKLTVHDRDGKIEMEGFATLKQDFSGQGGVYLEADKFPLRQQGQIIGELTTRARLDVKIPESLKADAQLKILDGRMWLTGERGKRVQSLDPHPDVRFADEKVEYESTPTEEKAEGQGFALGSFKMKTERELWLMHKDFSIQVGVDLALAQGEEGPTLEGEASLVRGELALLGKPFKLQRGSIRFAGPLPPDPELDIKAVFSPPAGRDLIVQVSGRGSSPVLEFSGAATTAGEAIMVLQGRTPGSSSKQGAESEASNSMAGIAADMTAGLLIMTARREFGDWVPMISVETGSSGQPTSARAGFDASKLIPPWAAGFAKSAYIEGIVGQSGASGGRVGVGVRLEVALPRDFITILGYGPNPGGWSTDVAWSP